MFFPSCQCQGKPGFLFTITSTGELVLGVSLIVLPFLPMSRKAWLPLYYNVYRSTCSRSKPYCSSLLANVKGSLDRNVYRSTCSRCKPYCSSLLANVKGSLDRNVYRSTCSRSEPDCSSLRDNVQRASANAQGIDKICQFLCIQLY